MQCASAYLSSMCECCVSSNSAMADRSCFWRDESDKENKRKWYCMHDALWSLEPPYVYHVVSQVMFRAKPVSLSCSSRVTRMVWRRRSNMPSSTRLVALSVSPPLLSVPGTELTIKHRG